MGEQIDTGAVGSLGNENHTNCKRVPEDQSAVKSKGKRSGIGGAHGQKEENDKQGRGKERKKGCQQGDSKKNKQAA